MSSETFQRAVRSPGYSAGINTGAAPYRAYVYAGCAVLAVALNYVLGKEMAWDLLHYHFYAGFSALNDRFEQDYFAAGALAYFHPYASLPFFFLLELNLSSLSVGRNLAVALTVLLVPSCALPLRTCPP